ncbi:MAG: hypothetical protein HQ472_04945 [Ignavibacteria bacterium]|nr:hypothetical protein [Ignavibacteria bacterium]
MRKNLIVLVTTFALLLLVSCMPNVVTHNQLNQLQKGMVQADVQKKLDVDPEGKKSFTVEGIQYSIEYYPLQTAQKKESTYRPNYLYKSGGSKNWADANDGKRWIKDEKTVDLTEDMYCLYQGGKLRYWGMVGEFAKSEDLQIQALNSEFFKYIRVKAD